MFLKRRTFVKILSFFMSAVLIVTVYAVVYFKKSEMLETGLEYNYDMYLNELDGSIYNICIALRKAMYSSSTAGMSTVAAQLCAESTAAKNSLSQLPSAESELKNVNRFLSQVGDFALFLSKKTAGGEEITQEERQQLHTLCVNAENLSLKIDEVLQAFERNGAWSNDLSQKLGQSVEDGFGGQLLELEDILSDYPTLIYDGPFSDHILNSEAQLLKGKAEVTLETARETALAAFAGEITEFSEEGEGSGRISTYDFYYEENYISISKLGGYIVNMRKFRVVDEYKIDYYSAVEIALEYIKSKSNKEFVSTYYFAEEGVCVVNLAYKADGVVCYSDLIKVGVALDTGEIVFIEAAGYIANHREREISAHKYSVGDAMKVLSTSLKVESAKQCIIPTDGFFEKYCYEFTCLGIDGERILVYINADNLQEERILLVLSTDGGTLVK